jgi:hypothetical protein
MHVNCATRSRNKSKTRWPDNHFSECLGFGMSVLNYIEMWSGCSTNERMHHQTWDCEACDQTLVDVCKSSEKSWACFIALNLPFVTDLCCDHRTPDRGNFTWGWMRSPLWLHQDSTNNWLIRRNYRRLHVIKYCNDVVMPVWWCYSSNTRTTQLCFVCT